MTAIDIQIQHKCYRHLTENHYNVIEDLHLSLAAQQFVCLIGPSGCGKTTLLNAIAGLDVDFKGHIHLHSAAHSAKIGYVFQNPRLLPWRTVWQNLTLVLDSPKQAAQILPPLLELMQLTAVQHFYPEQLSLGMQRRVAILRAFVINPDVLLMDEPFVSLDPPTARQAQQLLWQLWQQRPHTVLFVSHDLREAIMLADQLVFVSTLPMRILAEIPVTIPRNQRQQEIVIETFRQQLKLSYPQIQSLL
ncbi:MAG: hypothetical protein RL637_798 [Pseudomonadota bacterium]|jgi:NitT/TauT family transport system ATP-binding protein